jgi:hypothetical protein
VYCASSLIAEIRIDAWPVSPFATSLIQLALEDVSSGKIGTFQKGSDQIGTPISSFTSRRAQSAPVRKGLSIRLVPVR